jgi:hypothetical protein
MKTKHYLSASILVLALAACAGPSTPDSPPPAAGHDGAEGSPVTLTLGSVHQGRIGSYNDLSDSESFYQFNTGDEDEVILSLVSTPARTDSLDYDLRLFSDAAMEDLLQLASPRDQLGVVFTELETHTTYYLRLLNKVDAAATYHLSVGAIPEKISDGTLEAPQELAWDEDNTVTYAATISNGNADEASFYTFTAPADGTVRISYPDPSLDATLYTGSDFDSGSLDEEYSPSQAYFDVEVEEGETYYLEVDYGDDDFGIITGDLTITYVE